MSLGLESAHKDRMCMRVFIEICVRVSTSVCSVLKKLILKYISENMFGPFNSKSLLSKKERYWMMTWKECVPSKLKVFLSRLAQQSLPMVDLLHHRKMSIVTD